VIPDSFSGKEEDVQRAIDLVRTFDPAGYVPGLLLNTPESRLGYYGTRSVWVETGMRHADLPSASGDGKRTVLKAQSLTPQDRIDWWKGAIDSLYNKNDNKNSTDFYQDQPTVRLLGELIERHKDSSTPLSNIHFDNMLEGRQQDIDKKQYATIQELVTHTELSCGSLLRLVLEASGIDPCLSNTTNNTGTDDSISKQNQALKKAVHALGVCHGMTNALRTSIPVASNTGKLIVPAELCTKYGVRSPRYLLSSLGLGDEECRRALALAVQDLANLAHEHLSIARSFSAQLPPEALPIFLPGLASETFLRRLARSHHDLTNQGLRNVGFTEHATCTYRLVHGKLTQSY
jgi:phytoene/squalene synthetase